MGGEWSGCIFIDMSLFDLSAKTIKGMLVPLSNFKGKKCYLVVNVACK